MLVRGLAVATVFLVAFAAAFIAPTPREASAVQTTCFKTGEHQSGMSRICYYDCLGTPVAITVRATDLCPLTIQRDI